MAKKFESALNLGELRAPVVSRGSGLQRAARGVIATECAKNTFGDFPRGGRYFALTKGQFSMIDILAAMLDVTGPGKVTLWTWCVADYEITAIGGMMADSRVKEFRLIMDVAGLKRDTTLIEDLQNKFGDDCIRVTKTHAKIATISAGDWRVVIRGSMNLNENPRFENCDVTDDPEIFEVVAGMEREFWERQPAIKAKKQTHMMADNLFQKGGNPVNAVSWFAPK